MSRTHNALVLLSIGILAAGCASTLNGGKQDFVIDSRPAGAAVYLRGAEVGTTPYTYTYDLADGDEVAMEVRLEGHELNAFTLRPRRNNAVLFVDAMLLNIPYIWDGKSNALYGFPVDGRTVRLYRTLPDDAPRVEVPVTTVENRLGAKPVLGKVGTHPVTALSKEATDLKYPETLTASLVSGMKQGTFDAFMARKGTQRGDEAIKRAKGYVVPVLKRLEMKLNEVDRLCYGECVTVIEWQLRGYPAMDSVVFSLEKETITPIHAARRRDVIPIALHDAGRCLLDEEVLRERIREQHLKGLTLSKGGPLSLHTPRHITFMSRRDMMPELVKAVVTISTEDGHGSGFLITHDGHLLTNAHVVKDASTVKVRFEHGASMQGEVVKVNEDFDLALVKVPGNDLPALTIGNDLVVQVGEEVYAIGTPLDEKLGQTVTRGIVSGKREIEERSYIQTDVSINAGNSGGPLIDMDGKVIGVATLKLTGDNVSGLGFAVPITKALEMLNITMAP